MKITKLLFVIAAFLLIAFPTHAQVPDQVVTMRPFRVIAEMAALTPVRALKGGPILKLRVDDVTQGSAAYKAGLRKGMFVTQIHGMEVQGLTEKELFEQTENLRVTDNEFIVVATRSLWDSKELEFSIPVPRRVVTVAQK